MWQFRAALLRVLSFTSLLLHYKNAVVKLYLILSHQGRDSMILLKLLHVAVGERQQLGKVCGDKVFLFESSSNSVHFSCVKNQSLDQGDDFGNGRKTSHEVVLRCLTSVFHILLMKVMCVMCKFWKILKLSKRFLDLYVLL